MKRRAQFSEFISSTTSLTISRYFRLMALATVEILCTIPITAYGIYLSVTVSPVQPWRGFADAHYNYSHIGQYPSVIWRVNYTSAVSTELSRWSLVFCAFVFFGFFGFASEARKNYAKAYRTVARWIGVNGELHSTLYVLCVVPSSWCSFWFPQYSLPLPVWYEKPNGQSTSLCSTPEKRHQAWLYVVHVQQWKG